MGEPDIEDVHLDDLGGGGPLKFGLVAKNNKVLVGWPMEARSSEPIIEEALRGQMPFVERYGTVVCTLRVGSLAFMVGGTQLCERARLRGIAEAMKEEFVSAFGLEPANDVSSFGSRIEVLLSRFSEMVFAETGRAGEVLIDSDEMEGDGPPQIVSEFDAPRRRVPKWYVILLLLGGLVVWIWLWLAVYCRDPTVRTCTR